MKKILILFSFIILGNLSIAQQLITGTITDNNNKPLPDVKVTVTGTTKTTYSDKNGYYSIELAPGYKMLNFQKLGYMDQKVAVDSNIININMMAEWADILQLSIEELLNVPVYSVSKFSQKATDAPATVYVVTQAQIEARNYSCLEDLLEDIPQIEIQKKSISHSFDIFTVNGVYGSEKFIILYNGIRINSATGTTHTIGESYSLANVKQVEIILGPASSLYGADAFTGIINIVTNDANQNKGIHFSTQYGLYNTTDNILNYNTGNKDIAFSLIGKYYHTDEPFFPDFYKKDFEWYQYYKQTGKMMIDKDTVTPAIGIKPWGTPTNAYSIIADLKIKKFNFGYSRFYENHNNSISSFPSTNIYCKESAFISQIQNIYITHHYSSRTENFSLNSAISGQEYKIDPKTLYINQYTSYEKAYKYERNRTAKIEEQATYFFSEKFNALAGISYEYHNCIPPTSDLPIPYNESKTPEKQMIHYPGTNITDKDGKDLTIYQDIFNLNFYNIGSYLQFQYQIIKNLTVTAGSRFDYNSSYKSSINPRIGLVTKPIEKLTIKLLYSHAYLAPSPFKSYQHFGSFYPETNDAGEIIGLGSYYFFLPNPDLEPERRISYDTYLMYQITKDFAVSLNTYYGQITNLISTTGTENVLFHGVNVGYTETLTNHGSSTAYGGTTRLDYKGTIGNNFNLNYYAAYSYSDGKISNNPLIYSAKHTIKTGLDINYKNRFNLFTKVTYRTGSHYIFSTFDKPIQNDPYTIINTTGNYKIFQNNKFNTIIFASITNLLNTRYYNVGENFGLTPQDPIRADLGLKLNF